MGWWFGISLWKRVFLGLVLGVLFGLAASSVLEPAAAEALLARLKVVGDVFIAMIRLVIVPLIALTLIAGVLALGDPARLGTIGVKTIALYLGTTILANVIGLAMGLVFRPGEGVNLGSAAPRSVSTESAGFFERLLAMATKNPFQQAQDANPMTMAMIAALLALGLFVALKKGEGGAKASGGASGLAFFALFAFGVFAASADILFVIFLSLVIGVAALFAQGGDSVVGRFFAFASDKVLVVTQWVMELAPFGVFALIAYVAGTRGLVRDASVDALMRTQDGIPRLMDEIQIGIGELHGALDEAFFHI